MSHSLSQKDINVESMAEKTLEDEKIVSELLEGILSKNDTLRYNCYKVLIQISEKTPETLYQEWTHFENMMKSNNAYYKSIAVQIIANLTLLDGENKFEKIFDRYYDMLNDSVIVARNVVVNSGKIVKAKPELQRKIIKKLLNIDKTNQKHKGLVKGDSIEAFDSFFDEIENKEDIVKFVREQLNCESPKTRKRAKQFLTKWEHKI